MIDQEPSALCGQESKPYFLRAEKAYWENKVGDVTKLSQEQMLDLIKELDRRFIQLWDKVVFEREKGLLDYGKLK